jgi:phosphatidylserine/phosphatidylglycerophosphate/cardiolipin synthase-like enzyme
MRRAWLAIIWTLAASPAFAQCNGAAVNVCFRPGHLSCAAEIVDAIHAAARSLFVQAYGFTDPKIIQAIGDAQKRDLKVRVILDKENRPKPGRSRYTGAAYLRNAGVPVRIDDKVAIAHNKVMVIDGELVIGGSYNYTRSAETRNAENVTFIRSACVAEEFKENFERRWRVSD